MAVTIIKMVRTTHKLMIRLRRSKRKEEERMRTIQRNTTFWKEQSNACI